MKCFARWQELPENRLFIRDQTLLQFGNSWNLRTSFVLFNPGSAIPKSDTSQSEYLASLDLPYFIEGGERNYYEFHLDPLMRNLIKAASTVFEGGVIEIYNLFNIKNQNADRAVRDLTSGIDDSLIYTPMAEVKYLEAPVVIACGRMTTGTPGLERQLACYVDQADPRQLFGFGKNWSEAFFAGSN